MAGLLGRMAGGILEGAGAGMVKQAEQDGLATRLERLKELEFQQQAQRDARLNEMQTQRDATQANWQTERDTRLNEMQAERDARQHGYRVSEIGQATDRFETVRGPDGQQYQRNAKTGELKAMPGAGGERWDAVSTPDGGTVQRNARTGEVKAMPQGASAMGSPGEGLVWKRDDQGRIVRDENGAPIAVAYTGGKVAREEAQATEKRNLGKDARRKYGDVVTEDIDRALGMIDEGGFGIGIPVTGAAGSVTKNIPGTQAYDVAKLIDTVKANVGFDRLQEMRASSPTGAALGSVTEKELAFLQATVGALDQSQSKEQVVYNLRRVKNAFLDTIHGPGNGPEREPVGRNDRGTGSAPAADPAPVSITNDAAGKAVYDRLPTGRRFIAPDGTIRRKP